jgi:hypothetical protein
MHALPLIHESTAGQTPKHHRMLMKLLHRLWLACVVVLASMAYWAVGGFLFVLAGLVLAPLLPLREITRDRPVAAAGGVS